MWIKNFKVLILRNACLGYCESWSCIFDAKCVCSYLYVYGVGMRWKNICEKTQCPFVNKSMNAISVIHNSRDLLTIEILSEFFFIVICFDFGK